MCGNHAKHRANTSNSSKKVQTHARDLEALADSGKWKLFMVAWIDLATPAFVSDGSMCQG